jgi:hypothetical protein
MHGEGAAGICKGVPKAAKVARLRTTIRIFSFDLTRDLHFPAHSMSIY